MARWIIVWLGLSLAAGCGARDEPPTELAGLWSTGDASCAAGVGIRFTSDAIQAVYNDDEAETLFEQPRYQVVTAGEDFRVRITYALPSIEGHSRRPGAHGVLVLARHGELIAPVAHSLVDGLTGSARMRIADDPAVTALTLQPCGRHAWREPLRGLSPA
ncbi:MAG: hypothetical protein DCF16_18645 [Alphaproteobacteria bacterium]|nr:MAG: hypothetical protein DCF16_18645 [Alphaproteobacteria bacterium]